MWAIIILPLAVIMFGCGDNDPTSSGTGNGPDDELSADWEVTIQESGVEVTLQEVHFDPASGNGWVVGNDGVILSTTDKGATWEQQDSGETAILYSVHFVDGSDGWVVGDGGLVLHTEDGGATWERQNSGVTEQLRSVFFANDSEGWAVGAAGVIVNTRDGGNQWEPQSSGTNQDLEAIHFAPPPPGEIVIDHGWAVGLNATVINTTDGGRRWVRQVPARLLTTEPLYGVFFATGNKGWSVGKLGPAVMNTSNGGQTWGTSAAVDAASRMYDLHFVDAANGWSVGSGGILLHTSDGGKWDGVETEVTKTITTPLWGVSFIDATEGWAVGDAGVIVHIKSL
jgi:photosystem II stability/assembly factor-like uncharacterized protein